MDLNNLSRIDLLKVGATSTSCLQLYPLGKTNVQRIIVGDLDGVVNSFSVKKGYVKVMSKHISHSAEWLQNATR